MPSRRQRPSHAIRAILGNALEHTVKSDITGDPQLRGTIQDKLNAKGGPDVDGATTELWYKGQGTAKRLHEKLSTDPNWQKELEKRMAAAPQDGWHNNPAVIELQELQRRVKEGYHVSPRLKREVEAIDKIAHNRPMRYYGDMKHPGIADHETPEHHHPHQQKPDHHHPQLADASKTPQHTLQPTYQLTPPPIG